MTATVCCCLPAYLLIELPHLAPHNPTGARRLKDVIFKSIKDLWDENLSDDAVAEFTLALLGRGADRKRIHSNLNSVLGEDVTNSFLDW